MNPPKIAFLHTASVHEATFDRLLSKSEVEVLHTTREAWLEHARENGLDDRLRQQVEGHLRQAASSADVVVCTCSTLGPIAQDLGLSNVFRVDQPMMNAAAEREGTALLALCLESTQDASCQLLEGSYRALGKQPDYEVVFCGDAWPLFERGEIAEFGQHIAAVIRERLAQSACGSVVLAQASMAAAAPYLNDLSTPVYSSPSLAAQTALRLAGIP